MQTKILIACIHVLTLQIADLLGYKSWAAYAQEVQMAKGPAKVDAPWLHQPASAG